MAPALVEGLCVFQAGKIAVLIIRQGVVREIIEVDLAMKLLTQIAVLSPHHQATLREHVGA